MDIELKKSAYFAALRKNSELNKSSTGWTHNPKTGNFNHSLHGSISIRPSAKGGVEAVHNGALIGNYGDKHQASQGVVNYMRKLPSGTAHTRMFNMPSGQALEGIKKDGSNEPGSPHNPNSQSNQGGIGIDPDKAKAIMNGFNNATGSAGLSQNWSNLKNAVGLGKAEGYLRGRLERSRKKP